jgi:hypothetical protein
MGKFTVDLKHKKMFVTMDKLNPYHHRLVLQGSSHKRSRPDAYLRNSLPFPTERDGAQKLGHNFLGKAWCQKKGFKPNEIGSYLYDFPSLSEILAGLKLEATHQIETTSGCPQGSQLLQEAIDNICGTWDQFAELITNIDSETGQPKNQCFKKHPLEDVKCPEADFPCNFCSCGIPLEESIMVCIEC